MPDRFTELPVAAQTAYAELAEETRAVEMQRALADLPGSFHRLERRGKGYWYYSYRDPGVPSARMIYVGPDTDAVRALTRETQAKPRRERTGPQARAAVALGCAPIVPVHFRIVRRLADYGLFRAGGVLVGTHAFLVLGNILGVRWREPSTTLDVDIAHSGRNLSVALPARLHVDVHGALESLSMGFLPLTELDGSIGTRYRSTRDASLRVDFLTTFDRSGRAVRIPELPVALEPLRFMDYLLEDTIQGCALGANASCTVNVPAPERFAVHKLVVFAERSRAERTKATKDLSQAAALASYFLEHNEIKPFNAAWRALIRRGRGWAQRGRKGKAALLKMAPELDEPTLWRT